MHRSVLSFVVGALALTPAVSAQTASMSGTVLNEVTETGIPGVHVTLFTRQAVRYEVETSADGSFTVTRMQPGSYEARMEKEGYWSIGGRGATKVGDGEKATIRLSMDGLTTIRGKVVDIDGKPIANATARIAGLSNGIATAASGEFEIKELHPDFYEITVSPPTPNPAHYLPARTEKIALRGDGSEYRVEIRLRTGDSYRLSGHVVDETGQPRKNVRVSLLPVRRDGPLMTGGDLAAVVPAGDLAGAAERNVSSTDGDFSFDSVAPGQWRIAADDAPSGDVIDLSKMKTGAVDVLVSRSDVSRIEVRMGTAFEFESAVKVEGAQTAPVTMIPLKADGSASLPAIFGMVGGRPQLRITPGSYYLRIASRGYYATSMTMGGRDVLGRRIDVLATPPPVQVVVKQAQAVVRGKAEPNTNLVLVVQEQSDSLGSAYTIRPQADGSFQIAGVAPGSYYVAAFGGPTQIGGGGWTAMMKKAWTLGTRIRVEESGTIQVDNLKRLKWLE